MRSAFIIGLLFWIAVSVNSISRVENERIIHKRSPLQIYQGQQGGPSNSTQFQWVKVNNQWVRKDGTKLPGYSPSNVPYNQPSNQRNTPSPANNRNSNPNQGSRTNLPSSQGPIAAQGEVGWNPKADRDLTIDLPKTTPRPVTTTTRPPVVAQTPPPKRTGQAATPPPARAPFGSGVGGQQKPQGNWNPDASLTYGHAPGGRSPQPDRSKPTPKANPGPPGSNPWGGLFNR